MSPERFQHVHLLLANGLLNPSDVRTMLSRHAVGSLIERRGLDANEWPSLTSVTPPPSAKAAAPKRGAIPSHRGFGTIAPEKKDRPPSLIVLA